MGIRGWTDATEVLAAVIRIVNSAAWVKANPALGAIKKTDGLMAKVEREKQEPHKLSSVLCKEFNIGEMIKQRGLSMLFKQYELSPVWVHYDSYSACYFGRENGIQQLCYDQVHTGGLNPCFC